MINCEMLRVRKKHAEKTGQNPAEVNCNELECSGKEGSFLTSEDNAIVSSIEDEAQEQQLKRLEGEVRVDRFYNMLVKHNEIKERVQ